MLLRTLCLAVVLGAGLAGQEETPRQVFERAAYAEEHERDFAKAEQLYRNAGSMAKFLGDETLAEEAMKAIERVAMKRGATTTTQPSDQVPIEVQRRLYLLVRELSTESIEVTKGYDVMKQIVPFGAMAVPILEESLHARMITDPEQKMPGEGVFRGDSRWAARTLANIRGSDAAAALRRGLASADPFVRRAVVDVADPVNHRALLDQALQDANPSIVAAAIHRLSQSDDPSLLELMKSALYRDDLAGPAAARWLVRNRPEEVVAALKSEQPLASQTVEQLLWPYAKDPRITEEQQALHLLEVAEASASADRRKAVLQVLAKVNWLARLSPGVRQRIEGLALEAFEDEPVRDSPWWSLMGTVGGLRTAEVVAQRMSSGTFSPLTSDAHLIADKIANAGPSSFKTAARIVRDVAVAMPQSTPTLMEGLRRLASKEVSPRDLIEAYKTVSEVADLKAQYLERVVLAWGGQVPADLPREALRLESSAPARRKALLLMAERPDVSMIDDAKSALADPDSSVRTAAAGLLEAIAREHPEEALAAIEDLLKSLEPGNLSLLTAPLEALADERVIVLVERVWPAASRERRAAVGYMILSFDTPSGARLSWLKVHFEELVPDQRRLAIDKFRESLHEPAIDVIGKALTDPSPEVREAARKAIAAFREHREALEEFRRWKTGDAEARASIAELMKLLESQNRDVVAGAAKALGALKAQAALPALVKLLERDDPAIKQAVEDAIAKIGE